MGKRRGIRTGYLTILILLLFSFPAFTKTIVPFSGLTQGAATAEVKPKAGRDVIKPVNRSEFLFDTQVSAITYKEPNVMTESGLMLGFLGGYKYHSGQLFMFGLDGRMASGYVDYDGSLQDGTPFKMTGIPDVLYEMRSVIGIDVPTPNSSSLTIYYGLGYRCLEDNLQLKYSGGYFRQANYVYNPLGIEYSWSIFKNSSLGFMIENDSFVHGRQISKLSNVDRSYPDLLNEQNKGSGFRWSLAFRNKSEGLDMIFRVYQNNWSIEESEVVTFVAGGTPYAMIEPKNNSTETGASFGIIF